MAHIHLLHFVDTVGDGDGDGDNGDGGDDEDGFDVGSSRLSSADD